MERCDPNEEVLIQGYAFNEGGSSGAGDGACGEFRLLDVLIYLASAGCAGAVVGVREEYTSERWELLSRISLAQIAYLCTQVGILQMLSLTSINIFDGQYKLLVCSELRDNLDTFSTAPPSMESTHLRVSACEKEI
jgi:hypothetical protein